MKLRNLRPKISFEKKWPDLLAGILQVSLYVLGGMMLARWTWLLFAPLTPAPPQKIEQSVYNLSSTILAGHWFGLTKGRPVVTTSATVNFKLVGIYSPTGGKPGFAVFKLADGKQRAVLLNKEITPGISLMSIKPDGVQVGQEGSTQALVLEGNKSNTSAATPRVFLPAQQPPVPDPQISAPVQQASPPVPRLSRRARRAARVDTSDEE